MVTLQHRLELDLTQPGTSVFTEWYDQIHTPTPAPGVDSMPQLRLWRKRPHWRPFAQEAAVYLPCLPKNLCRNQRHHALRPQASGLASFAGLGLAGLRLSGPRDCQGLRSL